jgi:peptidoglycan/LPS O-acetylase OafA/YrhL
LGIPSAPEATLAQITLAASNRNTAATAQLGDLPKPRSPRYYSLDLWRGFACLLVVLHHATHYPLDALHTVRSLPDGFVWLTKSLWVGVPLFFVISGYCISAAADAARRRQNTVASYFRRRIRRIYPPFWVACLGTAVLVVLGEVVSPGIFTDPISPIAHPMSLSPLQWLGNLTLVESWRTTLIGGKPHYFMVHIWTLCYEEQFYAVTGLLLLVTRRRFFEAAGLTTLFSYLLGHLCTHRGIPITGFFFDGKWILFAVGILTYYRLNYAKGRQIWLSEGLFLLAMVYGIHQFLGDSSFLIAAGFAFLLVRIHRWDDEIVRCPILRPFVFCGTICYSLYLIHWPVSKLLSHGLYLLGVRNTLETVLITVPLCVAASIGAAWLFHVAVERRFLNSPNGVDRSSTGTTALPDRRAFQQQGLAYLVRKSPRRGADG